MTTQQNLQLASTVLEFGVYALLALTALAIMMLIFDQL
jgi:hypothetical protein